jgi:hypothetical protein
MSTIASEIFHARTKIKQLDEHREIAKERLKLLEHRSREIRELIASGMVSDELSNGLSKCQEEIKRTCNSLTNLKFDIRRWSDAAIALEKNAIDDMRNNGNMIGLDLPSMLIMKDIQRLQSRYAEFASDPTRVSSMRLMAAQFSEELGSIIKQRAA